MMLLVALSGVVATLVLKIQRDNARASMRIMKERGDDLLAALTDQERAYQRVEHANVETHRALVEALRDAENCSDPNVVRGRLARVLSMSRAPEGGGGVIVPIRPNPRDPSGNSGGPP